jgi:hypothetical protein
MCQCLSAIAPVCLGITLRSCERATHAMCVKDDLDVHYAPRLSDGIVVPPDLLRSGGKCFLNAIPVSTAKSSRFPFCATRAYWNPESVFNASSSVAKAGLDTLDDNASLPHWSAEVA